MQSHPEETLVALAVVGLVLWLLGKRKGWVPSTTAHGKARWASKKILEMAGMLAGKGLILGRTLSGSLIWIPRYCHVLLVGGTGSGKGVSIIIPLLLTYFRRGSVVVFDMKGDLWATTARRRRRKGERVLRFAPFNGGTAFFNPLVTIPRTSPNLVDSARAMAEALVPREGQEDPHWPEKAVIVITAILVLVLLLFRDEERNLNSVQDIASDPELVLRAGENLRKLGGIPGRLGSQLLALFDKEGGLSKEGASVLSTVSRALSFLDSELVAQAVSKSSFDVKSLLKPGTTLYLQIPAEHMQAQRNLLRCVVGTLMRVIGANGSEKFETLFVLDEASALSNLSAIEEALVRGRSAGIRLLLAYQSDSQVQAAFEKKPTLLYDNCSVQIYIGAGSIETAERICKCLGDYTQVLESYSNNYQQSWQRGGTREHEAGVNVSKSSGSNFDVSGRALLRPEEVLGLDPRLLIAFVHVSGVPPILAKRVLWYKDRFFRTGFLGIRLSPWWLAMASAIGLIIWGLSMKK